MPEGEDRREIYHNCKITLISMANPNLTFVIHGIKHPKRKLTRWILCLNIVPFKR
jgi:hypothetical protein